MKRQSILDQLKTNCTFEEVFSDIEDAEATPLVYRRKIGHIRADYDKFRWWNTVWPCRRELETPEICREIDGVYEALTGKDAFADLQRLRAFCNQHSAARVHPDSDDEFNFYLESRYCYFWLRCITRERDYNLYLHAFIK